MRALEGGGLVDDYTLARIDVGLAIFALGFTLAAVVMAGHHARRDRQRLLVERNRVLREADEESERLRGEVERLEVSLAQANSGDREHADPDEWGGAG